MDQDDTQPEYEDRPTRKQLRKTIHMLEDELFHARSAIAHLERDIARHKKDNAEQAHLIAVMKESAKHLARLYALD